MLAVLASMLAADNGRPVEAERLADAVDRWQYGEPTRPDDPATEGWAALLRAFLCRRGVEQMLADADEAARRFAAEHILVPGPALFRGIARVLRGDLDGGAACFDEVISVGEKAGAPQIFANALCQQSLLAMTRDEWSRAQIFARRAATVLRQVGIESALVCAVQARLALHRGDAAAVRQQLVDAQRLRPRLTYALPHLAVQARIELIRVHLALGDPAGARTLMGEVDEVLSRRPGLGTLVGEAEALRTRLSKAREASIPGASALTAAELRLLPLLPTHLSFRQIGREFFLSPNTVKTQALSIYRKLGASSRTQAVTRAQELGLLEQ
jgi:LuxR family maltose regulon positive regulatory protein